jgi:hypothetical protein
MPPENQEKDQIFPVTKNDIDILINTRQLPNKAEVPAPAKRLWLADKQE